ncbi:MAG: hypothetical protein AAF986_11265 [Pseudomonadota bacterium]
MAKLESEKAARDLLERIKLYWLDRGFEIDGSIKNAGYNNRLRSTVFEVETNLVAGRPPKVEKAV